MKKTGTGVLPHEWCFGAFLALTGLRLAVTGAAALPWSLVFFGCLLASAGVIVWARRNPTPLRWRVRLLFYPAAMGLSFFAMEHAVPLLGKSSVDDLLLAWDRALLGETPALGWLSLQRPWLADLAMAGYLFFFCYLIAGPGGYCVRDLALFCKCIVGLFVLYGLGFTGYTFLPAGGPHRFVQFEQPLAGVWLLGLTLGPVNDGSNSVDAFPSIHFAATLYLLLFDWQHGRRRFWVVLAPCLLLWFATLYLRFHYFVDLVGGVLVALAGWAVAQWWAKTSSASGPVLVPYAASVPVTRLPCRAESRVPETTESTGGR